MREDEMSDIRETQRIQRPRESFPPGSTSIDDKLADLLKILIEGSDWEECENEIRTGVRDEENRDFWLNFIGVLNEAQDDAFDQETQYDDFQKCGMYLINIIRGLEYKIYDPYRALRVLIRPDREFLSPYVTLLELILQHLKIRPPLFIQAAALMRSYQAKINEFSRQLISPKPDERSQAERKFSKYVKEREVVQQELLSLYKPMDRWDPDLIRKYYDRALAILESYPQPDASYQEVISILGSIVDLLRPDSRQHTIVDELKQLDMHQNWDLYFPNGEIAGGETHKPSPVKGGAEGSDAPTPSPVSSSEGEAPIPAEGQVPAAGDDQTKEWASQGQVNAKSMEGPAGTHEGSADVGDGSGEKMDTPSETSSSESEAAKAVEEGSEHGTEAQILTFFSEGLVEPTPAIEALLKDDTIPSKDIRYWWRKLAELQLAIARGQWTTVQMIYLFIKDRKDIREGGEIKQCSDKLFEVSKNLLDDYIPDSPNAATFLDRLLHNMFCTIDYLAGVSNNFLEQISKDEEFEFFKNQADDFVRWLFHDREKDENKIRSRLLRLVVFIQGIRDEIKFYRELDLKNFTDLHNNQKEIHKDIAAEWNSYFERIKGKKHRGKNNFAWDDFEIKKQLALLESCDSLIREFLRSDSYSPEKIKRLLEELSKISAKQPALRTDYQEKYNVWIQTLDVWQPKWQYCTPQDKYIAIKELQHENMPDWLSCYLDPNPSGGFRP